MYIHFLFETITAFGANGGREHGRNETLREKKEEGKEK